MIAIIAIIAMVAIIAMIVVIAMIAIIAIIAVIAIDARFIPKILCYIEPIVSALEVIIHYSIMIMPDISISCCFNIFSS